MILTDIDKIEGRKRGRRKEEGRRRKEGRRE